MNRTARRVLRTELLRGTAPIAAAALAVVGAVLLFNETEDWAGRWGPLAEYVRVLLLILVPLAVAAGAWQAGRERRRRIGGLMASTPRPVWQPVVLAWSAVTLATWAGLLLIWVSGAVLVAPVATYGGRSWWSTLSVAFVALAAACALGVVAGRLIPGRLVAPVAGLLSYGGLGVLTFLDSDQGWRWLVPTLSGTRQGTEYLEAGFQLAQAVWLATVAATLLVAAAGRRTWLAAVPAAAAVAAAVPIVSGPGFDRWRPDPAAQEQLCVSRGGPEVCLARVNAFLLDDVTPPVREALAEWDGVPGGFVRAVDAASHDGTPRGTAAAGGTAVLHLQPLISWSGGLSSMTEYDHSIQREVREATTGLSWQACTHHDSDDQLELRVSVERAAGAWAGGPRSNALGEALLSLPGADQRDWMGRYLAAARSCDDEALAELAEALR